MEIKAYQGDITKSTCDAIVNAAHEGLMGGGGVDGAIHRAAGPKLLQFCRDLPQVEKGVRCPVGEAKLTPGFNLQARHVIHTVAPRFVGSVSYQVSQLKGPTAAIYASAKPGGEDDLLRCYDNCLKLAEESNCKTIAFPSLGTGGHAWPIEIACKIAIKAATEFQAKVVERVEFCCFSAEDLKAYELAMAANG